MNEFLELLYDHDDFMDSLRNVADMGAGEGDDAIWWATRYTRDEEEPRPLNIKVAAVEIQTQGITRKTQKNVRWIARDFADTGIEHNSIDLVWCNNSLQCSPEPFKALTHWHDIMRQDAMLCLTVPYNHGLRYFRDDMRIDSQVLPGAYFNYTPANLLLLLASCGFDCRGGHFKFIHGQPWIYAAVYKGDAKPQAVMNWYELLDKKLLPVSAEQAIRSKGTLSDSDLIVEWIDHNVYNLGM